MKKTAVMILLSLTMTLVGCGAKDSGAQSGGAQNSANETEELVSTEADTNEESAAGDVLSDGVLTVGTNAEFPPFEFLGDDGEPDGFDVALIKAIGEKLGVEVQIENMEFDSLVASIGNKIDAAIAGMTITEERKNMVEFSDPYYEAVQYVIVLSNSDISTKEELEGKTIGVQLGTTGNFIVDEQLQNATAAPYNKAVDAVNDLINGRVDAVIIDKNPAEVFAEKFGDEVKIFDGQSEAFGFEQENYAIALPKGEYELVEAVNNALAEIKEDGTFDEFVRQYIGN